MSPEEAATLRRQMEEQASWGFVSRYGRTGRIQVVETGDKMLRIDTPTGQLNVKVVEDTTIHRTTVEESRTLTFEDLARGMLVTVDGSTGTAENAEAGEI